MASSKEYLQFIFIDLLEQKPFDQNLLKRYGLKNEDVVKMEMMFGMQHDRMVTRKICRNIKIWN